MSAEHESLATFGHRDLEHTYATALPELATAWEAAPSPSPALVVFNRPLAQSLGLSVDQLQSAAGRARLSGHQPGQATAVALAYAGHQFGGYSPRLGDGRALLLGEVVDPAGIRHDVHLKGSGRTPFARGGDGKATLGSMLREFLFAEAMHALAVPTTRALAVVTTGEQVARDTMLPGAILSRTARSHIRVGTFQYAAALNDGDLVARLADYTIERHCPELIGTDQRYLGLLSATVEAQAALVSHWMLLGFVHGVLNTDNVLISGETIDYGPCAFMDHYSPSTVFSSIDHQGRYAFGNQPPITMWNLARFAETLLPLIDDDADASVAAATEVLESFRSRFADHWNHGMAAKLGLAEPAEGQSTKGPSTKARSAEDQPVESDEALFDGLLSLLEAGSVDYTSAFVALTAAAGGHDGPIQALIDDRDSLDDWLSMWRTRLAGRTETPEEIAAAMGSVNPRFIPRNHLVDAALRSADAGDMAPFTELLAAVTDPFGRRGDVDSRFSEPAGEEFSSRFQTFCGT